MPLTKPWNMFLTGPDRANLEEMAHIPVAPVGARMALVLLNVTSESFAAKVRGPGGSGARAARALAPLQAAAELARGAGIPMVHARRSIGGSDADLGTALRPRPKDTEITMSATSAFWQTDLDAALRAQSVDSLVLAGGAASTAVRATATDGQARGYHVALLEAAIFDRFEASYAITLFDLHLQGVELIDQETLADRFRAQSPHSR